MAFFVNFFTQERQQAGWRFWLFWVAMTNIGFFIGLEFSEALAGLVPNFSNPQIMEAAVSAVSSVGFAFLVGLLQAIVLRRHINERWMWFWSMLIGWPLGIFLGNLILLNITPWSGADFLYILVLGGIAGLVVGAPTWLLLRGELPGTEWWWILVNGFAWLVFFPGMITGLVLAWMINRSKGALHDGA